jgi:antitoxin VapB
VALNIKNKEVERLAREVANRLRRPRRKRFEGRWSDALARLAVEGGRRRSKEHMIEYFHKMVQPNIPKEVRGKRLRKREREKILGYGPYGV